MTPKTRAKKSAEAMWADDAASAWFGMRLIAVDEGCATLELTVEAQHCNGHGMCHGGVTFSLADSAFAFACNSRNQRCVAQHNMISFTAPAQLGDVLTAIAREVEVTGRNGIYDSTVTNGEGRKVAEMRGFSRAIRGQLFSEEA